MPTLRETLGIPEKYSHYYGDIVRILFFAAGIIMLVTLPLFRQYIPGPVSLSVSIILLLVLIAGLTNPLQYWLAVVDAVVSAGGFVVFEYYTVSAFTQFGNIFFFTNQLLAIIFFFALYYSIKTIRGHYLRKTELKTS